MAEKALYNKLTARNLTFILTKACISWQLAPLKDTRFTLSIPPDKPVQTL